MYRARDHYRNDIAATYIEQRTLEPQWHVEQEVIDRLLHKYASRGEAILDAPIGTGRFIPLYLDIGLHVYGMDISDDMLNEARKSLEGSQDQAHLIIGDIETITLSDDIVDHVICTRFLNWVPTTIVGRVLGEFARVSRGKVIVEVRVGSMQGAFRRLTKSLTNSKRLTKSVFASPNKLADYVLRLIRAAFNKLASGDATGSGSISQTHKQNRIMELISNNGLQVVEELTLDESYYNPRWISRPLKVFVLQRAAIGPAKEDSATTL